MNTEDGNHWRHFHVLEENAAKPFESAFFTREEVANPLIKACEINDHDMILLLLEYGFVVWDPKRVSDEIPMANQDDEDLDDASGTCCGFGSHNKQGDDTRRGDNSGEAEMAPLTIVNQYYTDGKTNNHYSFNNNTDTSFYPYHPCHPTRWFASYACQRALCSSSYINLTESETVMRCLELAGRFKRRAHADPDHAEAYFALTNLCINYAKE